MRDGEVDANAHRESAQSRTPKPPHGRHPHNGMGGGAIMTPESSEGRERIARMEVQIDSNRRQIETLAPLALQVGLVQRSQEELREDMKELRQDIDARFDRQERSIGNQFAACSQEIARVAKALERKEESEATNQTSRRAMWGLIGAAAVAGVLGFITQLVTALS